MTPELSQAEMSKMLPLQQKRTLAFVNHFVTTNVQFLNNFMKTCEQKLMAFERKLEKVNAALVLLEARLSSIPEVNTQEPEIKAPPPVEQTSDTTSNEPQKESEVCEMKTETVSRPEYDRFVKMVQVGVPVQAVKLKVSLEGLDPTVLEEILSK